MSEPSTRQDLVAASAPLAPLAPKKSLIADLAQVAGIDPKNFYEAVKVAAGCPKGATDAHFMVLLVQAERYQLDPLRSPPMLQLLDVGQGPQVYARVDTYYEFIQRAISDGKVEWTEYEEGWFLDPRVPPEKKVTRRGGRVTGKLRGSEKLRVKTVWFDEWSGGKKWTTMGSQMLEHRAHKEWARQFLGYYLQDTDDAERIEGNPVRKVEAEVADARPAIKIEGLHAPGSRMSIAPPPADLEEKPQETARHAGSGESEVAPANSSGTSEPAPAALDDDEFNQEESRRLDREAAGLFGDKAPDLGDPS